MLVQGNRTDQIVAEGLPRIGTEGLLCDRLLGGEFVMKSGTKSVPALRMEYKSIG